MEGWKEEGRVGLKKKERKGSNGNGIGHAGARS